MYTLRLTWLYDEEIVAEETRLDVSNDDEAIKLGRREIQEMSAKDKLVQARVCRAEEVIWSLNDQSETDRITKLSDERMRIDQARMMRGYQAFLENQGEGSAKTTVKSSGLKSWIMKFFK